MVTYRLRIVKNLGVSRSKDRPLVSSANGFEELRTEVREGFRVVHERLGEHDRRLDSIESELKDHEVRLDRIETKLDNTITRVDDHNVRSERLEKREH